MLHSTGEPPAPQANSTVHRPNERELFLRWQRDSDPAAREALVERFAQFTRNLARRYSRSSEPFAPSRFPRCGV